jgi:hypothetical protein
MERIFRVHYWPMKTINKCLLCTPQPRRMVYVVRNRTSNPTRVLNSQTLTSALLYRYPWSLSEYKWFDLSVLKKKIKNRIKRTYL